VAEEEPGIIAQPPYQSGPELNRWVIQEDRIENPRSGLG